MSKHYKVATWQRNNAKYRYERLCKRASSDRTKPTHQILLVHQKLRAREIINLCVWKYIQVAVLWAQEQGIFKCEMAERDPTPKPRHTKRQPMKSTCQFVLFCPVQRQAVFLCIGREQQQWSPYQRQTHQCIWDELKAYTCRGRV